MIDIRRNHDQEVVTFFDQELDWWTDVYHEDLPRGFFSFEMRRRLELVAEHLATAIKSMDNPAVLECGCGPGDILELLMPLQCTLTGLDLNPRYLKLASKKAPVATLLHGNVEELPFPDESFDIVYAVGVLMYLNDEVAAMKEINRITKKNGLVLISVPNYWMIHLLIDPYYIYRQFAKTIGLYKNKTRVSLDTDSIKRYTLSQLVSLFDNCDFHITSTMSTSYGPLRIWRKRVLPISLSIHISEAIRKLSNLKYCRFLKRVGNHWIITLRKGHNTSVHNSKHVTM